MLAESFFVSSINFSNFLRTSDSRKRWSVECFIISFFRNSRLANISKRKSSTKRRKATTSGLGDLVRPPMDRRCWKIVRPVGFAVIVHPEVNSSEWRRLVRGEKDGEGRRKAPTAKDEEDRGELDRI